MSSLPPGAMRRIQVACLLIAAPLATALPGGCGHDAAAGGDPGEAGDWSWQYGGDHHGLSGDERAGDDLLTGDQQAGGDTLAPGGDEGSGPLGGDDSFRGACNLSYPFVYDQPIYPLPLPRQLWDPRWAPGTDAGRARLERVQVIAHAEEPPPGYRWVALPEDDAPQDGQHPASGRAQRALVLPAYNDDLPLFGRAQPWAAQERRCYELPDGDSWLSEAQAYDLYRDLALMTTGVALDESPGSRAVVGLRGCHPGQVTWHGNWPDRFNDTLVLLRREADGTKRVREWPAHTDTGDWDFGVDSSSSLRPNRRYRYVMGWHRGYNALAISESGYRVRDDGNNNGHWDSDRNGWWPPLSGDQDRDRVGSAHNIHTAERDGPLWTAPVANGSAGCQVIPGIANWTAFITALWTSLGTPVDYFLLDGRDLDQRVFAPCTPDGTHQCPYLIPALPFSASGDTAAVSTSEFDRYNCSTANEGGPEVVYLLTTATGGTLTASVTAAAGADPDVHLLDADDPNACLARAHISFSTAIDPGRYFIVVDTWVNASGVALAGGYTLNVSLTP